jgi:hypothetical protein
LKEGEIVKALSLNEQINKYGSIKGSTNFGRSGYSLPEYEIEYHTIVRPMQRIAEQERMIQKEFKMIQEREGNERSKFVVQKLKNNIKIRNEKIREIKEKYNL